MKPTKAPAGTLCQPHRERAGVQVAAVIIVGGTAMCRACFLGQSPLVSPKLFAQKPVAARSNGAKAFGYMLNRWPVPPGNPPRRKPNKGQWAIALARIHPEHGIGGTGNRDQGLMRAAGKFAREELRRARMVLRYSRELADQVTQGAITLNKAWRLVEKEKSESPQPTVTPYTHVEGTKAQKAMALAMRFPGGKFRGDAEAKKYQESGGFSYRRLKQARQILRHDRELAEAVLRGDTALNVACVMVQRAKQEERRLRTLQSAGRFQMHPYPG
jgi:hypothetical protein